MENDFADTLHCVIHFMILVKPTFEGCYIDTVNRDLDGYINNVGRSNSVQTCVATCKRLGKFI